MQDQPQQPQSDNPDAPVTGVRKRAASIEMIGELILLTAVAAFFIYMFVLSLGWPTGARLTPQIAVGIGTPFLIWRFVHVIRVMLWMQSTSVSKAQIMDVGFRVGDDPKAEGKRFLNIVLGIAVLYLGIWLIGFHITVPLWVFVYMYWVGKARLWVAALVGLLFVGLIIGIYDALLRAPWNEPILFQLFT